LALVAAQAVLKQELDRKLAKFQPALQRARKLRRVRAATAAPAAPAREQPHDRAEATPAAGAREQAAPSPGGKRKRVRWTRETIVNELATWMSSGTAIDATFVTRHGPPGLVAAARRIFGRFDAALNVAALQFSKMQPEETDEADEAGETGEAAKPAEPPPAA
jgi:hypothetical protein